MGKGGKHIRRLFRTLIGIVLLAAVLLFVVGIVFMIPSVQTKAAQKATEILSEQLQTEITIEKLRLHWNLDVQMEGLCLKDQHGQPVLAFKKMKSHLPQHSRSQREWRFNHVDLDGLLCYVAKYRGEEGNNLSFIFDRFKSDKEKKPVRLIFKNVTLKGGSFTWYNEPGYKDDYPGVWNYTHIRLQEIDADIDRITVADGACVLDIGHLDCMEQSGFIIRNMHTLLTVCNQKLYLEDTEFETDKGSRIDMDFRFDFQSWKQFQDFHDSVYFRCLLRPSVLQSRDLCCFTPALHGLEPLEAHLEGKVDNCLSLLEITHFNCKFDDSTRIRGDLYTEGLQNGRNARWNAEIRELAVPMHRIDGLHLPGGGTLDIPEKLKNNIIYDAQADFHGSFDDFTTDVELTSDLGEMRAFGSYCKESGKARYNARFQSRGLKLQQLLNSDILGALTAHGEINGSGSDIDEYSVNISSLEFKGRTVHNARIHGDLEDKRLSFQVTSADSELQAGLQGFAEFGQNMICYAAGDITRFNLSAFHILPEDSNAILSLHTQVDMNGSTDSLAGNLLVSRASLTENGREIRVPTFRLISEPPRRGEKSLKLQSRALQASIDGRVNITDILPCMTRIVQQHLPHSIGTTTAEVPDSTEFALSLNMTQTIPLIEALLPNTNIGAGLSAEAHYAAGNGTWQMEAMIPSFSYRGSCLKSCSIQSGNSGDTLKLTADCGQFLWNTGDSLSMLEKVQLTLDCFRDTACFRLQNQPDATPVPPYFDLKGQMLFEQYGQGILKLQNGSICLHNNTFDLDTGSEIVFEKNRIQVNNFMLRSGEQYLSVNGTHAPKQQSLMDIRTMNLDLSELEFLTQPYGIKIGGIATGDMHLVNRHPALQLTTRLDIDSLLFNDVIYGRLESRAHWRDNEKEIAMLANLYPLKDTVPDIHLQGYYKPENRHIDVNGDIRTFDLHAIAPYLSSFASEVEGFASGKLRYAGTLQKASLTGNLHLDDAQMRIGYINTTYLLKNQDIEIKDSAFLLKNVLFTDLQGHQAHMDGSITHRQLKHWGMQLNIRAESTMMLHTDYRDNDLFYGNAFGTGNIRLRLIPDGDFFISGNVRTESQTYVTILLNKGANIQKEQSYIVFEKPYSLSNESDTVEKSTPRSSRTRLYFQLDATPEATLKVVLDPSVGGTIIGNGNGSIRMEMQPEKPFELYGSYTLSEGSVDLKLSNFFSRTLQIENGSTLSWNGQPNTGNMNVRASYSTKTSITQLLGESSVTSSYRSVPVSTGLRLKGEIFNPEFDIDIRLDDVDESIRSMVYNTLDTTNKESMLRQAVSLMLLGRFDVQRNEGEANNVNFSLGHSLSGLFSSYLQKMMSTLTDNVNVGFNYRPGDGITNGDEYNMQISTNLMENRLVIRGNLDIYGDNNEQNERQAVAGNVVGDIIVEYKITKDGSLRIKAFNMANYYDVLSAAYSDVPYYQGIGFSFTKDFDNLKGLFSRKRK